MSVRNIGLLDEFSEDVPFDVSRKLARCPKSSQSNDVIWKIDMIYTHEHVIRMHLDLLAMD